MHGQKNIKICPFVYISFIIYRSHASIVDYRTGSPLFMEDRSHVLFCDLFQGSYR